MWQRSRRRGGGKEPPDCGKADAFHALAASWSRNAVGATARNPRDGDSRKLYCTEGAASFALGSCITGDLGDRSEALTRRGGGLCVSFTWSFAPLRGTAPRPCPLLITNRHGHEIQRKRRRQKAAKMVSERLFTHTTSISFTNKGENAGPI